MPSLNPIYVVITPTRDEADKISFTLASMVAQSLRPAEWIIVDDGSTDQTAAMVQEYSRQHSWIRLFERQDRGRRLPGTGVVEAFYEGYHSLQCAGWEFLVKLDADLSFNPDPRSLAHSLQAAGHAARLRPARLDGRAPARSPCWPD